MEEDSVVVANGRDESTDVIGNHLSCGSSLQQPCISGSSVPVSSRKSRLDIIISGVSCGVFILLSLLAIFIYRYRRLRRLRNDLFVDVAGEDECKISFGQLRRFSWREIQLCTDNFSESNVIGQGGFGKVYKGVLLDNTMVAVKRLTDYHSPGGEAAFLREVHLISVAVHRNLLRLIGFCTTSSERILVYPFMQNLSVAYPLRGCCYSKLMQDSHTCVERAMHHNCPVCFEYLFETTSDIMVFPCGHTIHLQCVKEMEQHFQYSCAVCSKSYCDMSRVWEKLDQGVYKRKP